MKGSTDVKKDRLRAAFKHQIKVDENGCAVLDKMNKIVVKRKGHQKWKIAGDIDDDAQQATPKKMKPESSDPSGSGSGNQPTAAQQATPKITRPESSDPSVSGTENQPTDNQQATMEKMKPKSPQSSVLGTQNHPIDVDAT